MPKHAKSLYINHTHSPCLLWFWQGSLPFSTFLTSQGEPYDAPGELNTVDCYDTGADFVRIPCLPNFQTKKASIQHSSQPYRGAHACAAHLICCQNAPYFHVKENAASILQRALSSFYLCLHTVSGRDQQAWQSCHEDSNKSKILGRQALQSGQLHIPTSSAFKERWGFMRSPACWSAARCCILSAESFAHLVNLDICYPGDSAGAAEH